LIEGAAEKNILLIGTTNRIDAVDTAMLRRGRFDLQIEVNYPGEDEIMTVLKNLLDERPTAPGLNLDVIAARLSGRPMSDISWFVNEAARRAVRGGKDRIDDISLMGALKTLVA
jgi:cell division protease FtsH